MTTKTATGSEDSEFVPEVSPLFTIEIADEFDNAEELAVCLEGIARMLRQGYKGGYYPTWRLINNK